MANLKFKSSEEVKKAIMATQQQEIKQLYDDWADELEEKVKYYSLKTNASAPVTERYYKELQKQLRETSQQVSNEIYQKIKTNIYMVSDAVVKDNVEWLKMFGFSEEGLNAAFSFVPNQTVQKLVTGQIYEGGWNLSSKIWGDNEQTLKDIYKVMARGLAENKPIYDIAKDLETYVRPEAKLAWNLKDPNFGGKIYKKKVDYNAQRLARTLVQHGYQQSFIETTKENPFVTKYRWLSNGSRVCPLCLSRHNQLFDKDKLPMDHPNGMCVMQPVVADDMNDQLAKWFNSPDGTYPEIDKFASGFGYEGSSVIDVQSYIDKYGKTSKPYSSWYKSMTVVQKAEGAALKAKEGLSWEKWFNKYISNNGSTVTTAPVKTAGKKKVASEAAAGLSKEKQKAIAKLESEIAKTEAKLNALADEINAIPVKTAKGVFDGTNYYGEMSYANYSSSSKAKKVLKNYIKEQKEFVDSLAGEILTDFEAKTLAQVKKKLENALEFEEYAKKMEAINKKILKEKKNLAVAKEELKKIADVDEKKVQAFSDIQEKYLKPYGFTKDNMPHDFDDWSHKVSYDQASDILKSMGTSWADPHPYQQLMKFYDQNLTDKSFVMKAASSVNKVENTAKAVGSKTKAAETNFDYAAWHKAIRNNNLDVMETWCDDWLKVISPEERKGIVTYTGSAYHPMNNYLRGIGDIDDVDLIKKFINQCQAALEKASLPEEVIVRRGSGYNMLEELGIDISLENKDKFIGAIVNEKGFLSTSPASGGGFGGKVEYVIKVPKGSQAMYVDTISRHQGEQELLINSGGKFIVEEVEFDSFGNVKKIYMTLKNLKGSK